MAKVLFCWRLTKGLHRGINYSLCFTRPILHHQSFFQKPYFMNVKCVQCKTSLLWLYK